MKVFIMTVFFLVFYFFNTNVFAQDNQDDFERQNKVCQAQGYDCYLDGECLVDGKLRANAKEHADYEQAIKDLQEDLEAYRKYPDLFYICPASSDNNELEKFVYSKKVDSARWIWEENAMGRIESVEGIIELLSIEFSNFENPKCLKDTILDDPLFQARIASGGKVIKIDWENVVEEKQGKGVFFIFNFNQRFEEGPKMPMTFCKIKD